jgi:hypothetical protein
MEARVLQARLAVLWLLMLVVVVETPTLALLALAVLAAAVRLAQVLVERLELATQVAEAGPVLVLLAVMAVQALSSFAIQTHSEPQSLSQRTQPIPTQ